MVFPLSSMCKKIIRKLNIQRHFLSQSMSTQQGGTLTSSAIPPPVIFNSTSHAVTTHSVTSNSTLNVATIHSGLSNPSLFNPAANTAHSVNVFRSLVLNDLDKLPKKRIHQDPTIQAGLQTLCAKKNIIIRPADKGGGMVILDKEAYLQEMYRLLGDNTTYIILPGDPTSKYKKALTALIKEGSALNILNKKEAEYLVPLAPRIPVIYYLPKVHKDVVNPPGRPIVSGD